MYYRLKYFLLLAALFVVNFAFTQSLVVKTNKGYIRGLNEGGITVFKGVPYAAPPIGNLRFKTTQEHLPWTDTLAATKFGAMAKQSTGGSEDCLTLNIYTPKADNVKRPVLVWVHGGGMTGGAGKGENGHDFSDRDDIITITINYRLGIFGFTWMDDVNPAYAGSSNNGVADCIMALKWIKQNIAAFGGNPNQVTIMGESAGGKLISAVSVARKSKGLFQQFISESGNVQCVRDLNTAKNARKRILQQLHLGEKDVAKMLTMPADSLMKAQNAICKGMVGILFYGPVNDGVIINDDPYHYVAAKNLPPIKAIIGSNKTEATGFMSGEPSLKAPDAKIMKTVFGDNADIVYKSYLKELPALSPYDAATKVFTRYWYEMHAYRWSKALVQNNTPVWMFRFDYGDDALGATHGKELPFVWYDPESKSTAEPVKRELAVAMHSAWVAFIKTGDPSTKALPWPAYKINTKPVMLFNTTNKVAELKDVFDDPAFPTTVMVLKN